MYLYTGIGLIRSSGWLQALVCYVQYSGFDFVLIEPYALLTYWSYRSNTCTCLVILVDNLRYI